MPKAKALRRVYIVLARTGYIYGVYSAQRQAARRARALGSTYAAWIVQFPPTRKDKANHE